MNPSSSSSGGVSGRKSSLDGLGGPSDFLPNAGDTIGSLGGGRAVGGYSPGHGASFPGGTSFGSAAFLNSGTCQFGTRGIIEYLIRIVLNTLETQVHVCKERSEDDVFDSPSMFLPRLRGTCFVPK